MSLQFFRDKSFRQRTAVILAGHDLTVGTGGTQGDEVTTVRLVEVDGLGEDITRLTDRTDDIIRLYGLITREVLDLMISLVERRTDEVRHAGIDDGKLLRRALLDIEATGDQ